MNVIDSIARGEVTLILIGWPLAFLWLMKFFVNQQAHREERLIKANEGWQLSFDKLSIALTDLTSVIERTWDGR